MPLSVVRFPAAESAPVAQLDRAPDYESGGQEFESLRARHQLFGFDSEFLRDFSALDNKANSGSTGETPDSDLQSEMRARSLAGNLWDNCSPWCERPGQLPEIL